MSLRWRIPSTLLLAIVFLSTGVGTAIATADSDQPVPVVYNVRDLGAKGDGIADDTAAIQRAIDQAGTIPVYLPSGVYKVSDAGLHPSAGGRLALRLRSGLTLFGDGASTVIRLEGGTDWTRVLSGKGQGGIYLHDLAVDANAPSATVGGSGEQRHGIFLDGCLDSVIARVMVTRTLGDGIFLYGGSERVTVEDCVLIAGTTANPRVGINFQGASYCLVQRNRVEGYDCAYKAELDEGDADSIGNQILYNHSSGGMGLGLNGKLSGKCRDYVVAGNTFDCPDGMDQVVWISRTRDCTFRNNTVVGAGSGFYSVFDNRGLLLDGNRCSRQTYSAVVLSNFLGYGASDGIRVMGNVFTSPGYKQGVLSLWAAEVTGVEVGGNAYPDGAVMVNNAGGAPAPNAHDNVTGSAPVVAGLSTTATGAQPATVSAATVSIADDSGTTTTTVAPGVVGVSAPGSVPVATASAAVTLGSSVVAAPQPLLVLSKVRITSPARYARVPRGRIAIRVAVSRPDVVWRVMFYVDGKRRSQDYSSPFAFAWNTRSLAHGSRHTIRAVAYDIQGRRIGQAYRTVAVK